MKTQQDIDAALGRIDENAASAYPGMTYEQGVTEALRWVLEEIADIEFEYANDEL